jgi:hypothetical protein
MKENNENIYSIRTFVNNNDRNMYFNLKIDIFEKKIIIDGYYKIKLEGSTKYRLFDSNWFKLGVNNNNFDDIIDKMINNINERVEFAIAVQKTFKNIDSIGFKK